MLYEVITDSAVPAHRNDYRVFPVGVFHRDRVVRHREVDRNAFRKHRGDDHEDVITSYSIHYTKLYEVLLEAAAQFDSQPSRLFFERFLPDLDGLGALGCLDNVLDLVAGTRCPHQSQPSYNFV